MKTKEQPTSGLMKLTTWKNEPTVLMLKDDLEIAKNSNKDQGTKIKHWNNVRNVTGPSKPAKIKGRSQVQPKLVRRQAEWRYSALSEPFLGSDKLFDVEPRTFEDMESAEQNEMVLNYQFDTKINKVKFIDEYVRTTVDEGTTIVRLGWHRDVEIEEVEVPIFEYVMIESEEEMAPLQQALQMKEEDPNGYMDLPEELRAACEYTMENEVPVMANIVGKEIQKEEKIVENKPLCMIMHPDNVFIDPTHGGDYEKAGFWVISYETSKAELKKDGRFKNLEAVNWSGNTILSQPDHTTMSGSALEQKDDIRKKVVAYEYWGMYDINGDEKLVPIVATWIGDTMIRMEKNPFPDQKPPFVVVNYLPVKREVFGEPDAEILEDNQKILGAVTRGVIDLLGRSANSQQGFSKNFLDVTNRRKFENGQDYEFNPGGDPRVSIYQHTYPEIPNSAMNVMALQNQEAESLTGVKGFAGGVSGEAYGEVAAGIRGVLDAASKREMNILRRLAKGMQDIGRKIIAMNAVFLADEEVVRITNKEFIKVRREDLKGNFDLKVDISTAEIDEQKSQDMGFMLQTMGPNMDPAMSRMILSEIAKLKRMPALAEQIARFQPQPDPMEEQLKQLELAKLQKEVEKLDSEINLNRAKAMETEADAQRTVIETEQDISGVNHQRELEKQTEQSRGNQNLEVTKGLLKPQKEMERSPDVESAIGFNELSRILDSQRGAGTNDIGSKNFDPALDPALNPSLQL